MNTSDILPAPFEWIAIPEGRTVIEYGEWSLDTATQQYEFTLNATQVFKVEAFTIAKYPVTNAQFAAFIAAGGYDNESWWTHEGWRQRRKKGWTTPRYWADARWNAADHPVVGVSWYEAVAFTLWLSATTGEAITLPTEAQWQRAAQGDDQRTFPWGETWDATRCNNNDGTHGVGGTTPVTRYTNGASPFGVVDMAGNVWEWTRSNYDFDRHDVHSPAQYRALHGGAWDIATLNLFYTAARIRMNPELGNESWGFRIVRE